MLCSVEGCERPGAWPGERYCLGHLFVAPARRVARRARRRVSTPFAGWPRRFRVIGRTKQ
jgi:hypothetical protein